VTLSSWWVYKVSESVSSYAAFQIQIQMKEKQASLHGIFIIKEQFINLIYLKFTQIISKIGCYALIDFFNFMDFDRI
jgi:hypothetical protein